MNFLDIVIGILLAWSLYKGIKNGLFVELASLIALIAGIYGAIHFSDVAANYLSQKMEWNESYLNIASFLVTFLLIVVVVHMAGRLLTKIADFAMLGALNKLAGGIFGVLKTAIIVGALLVFIERASSQFSLIDSNAIASSVFYRPIRDIGALVFQFVLKENKNSDAATS